MITIIITGARQVPIANVIITSGRSCPDSTTSLLQDHQFMCFNVHMQ
jgi:hypothetical protein